MQQRQIHVGPSFISFWYLDLISSKAFYNDHLILIYFFRILKHCIPGPNPHSSLPPPPPPPPLPLPPPPPHQRHRLPLLRLDLLVGLSFLPHCHCSTLTFNKYFFFRDLQNLLGNECAFVRFLLL